MTHYSEGENRQSGMTLIEVMVAMAIFSFALLTLGALQVATIQANAKARRMSEATHVLGSQIEQLMATPWSAGSLHADLSSGTHNATQGPYSIQWTVANDAGSVLSKIITVSVQWTEGNQNKALTQATRRVRH